jgi:hypothetical protein
MFIGIALNAYTSRGRSHMEGVEVNIGDAGEVAPIFKGMLDIDDMRALCIGEEETLDFGSIGDLRAII